MSIFMSCGEVSGDLYASDLIREFLRSRGDAQEIWGMMGPRGVKAGGEAIWSYEELKLMGITEVIPAIPRILKLRDRIVNEVLRRDPAAVVVVDSPDFHLGLVKKLRRVGYRGLTVCLVTPTVWAWRRGRTRILRNDFDLCLPLFSFEHDFLTARGVHSQWAAHPLVSDLAGHTVPEELSRRYRGERVIALMAGSRRYDIKYHIDCLLGTARILGEQGFLPVFSVAPGLSEPLRRELLERVAGFERWEGEGRDLMAVSEAVAGVSGTVAVEAMLMRCFMVVIYDVNLLSWLILRTLVRVPYISIPNYLTDRPVYPELLRTAARPERIVHELLAYLDDPAEKAEIDRRLEIAQNAMGAVNAAAFWARVIEEAIIKKRVVDILVYDVPEGVKKP
ncbi:MAG: lipid-A-disaccharide synthase [Synergistaceae bacterium]|jgi:lipid-A-disaccharide synthase|nr:lipid-A-disaccharide synthase [Synergistaceae bacterium]